MRKCKLLGKCSNIAILKRKLKLKDKRIEELEAENRILSHELAEVRVKLFSRKTKDKKDKEKLVRQPKKKGAPKGHPGWFCHPSPALNHHVSSIEPLVQNYI